MTNGSKARRYLNIYVYFGNVFLGQRRRLKTKNQYSGVQKFCGSDYAMLVVSRLQAGERLVSYIYIWFSTLIRDCIEKSIDHFKIPALFIANAS